MIFFFFIWFNVSNLFILKKQIFSIFYGLMFQDFSSLTHIYKILCISLIHHFHLLPFYFTIYRPIVFHTIIRQIYTTKNNVIYLQSFDNTYLAPTLFSNLIVTHMSYLQLSKSTCILYWVTTAITILMLRLDIVDLWVL